MPTSDKFHSVLNDVLNSDYFRRKGNSRSMLRYLAEHSWPRNRAEMREASAVAEHLKTGVNTERYCQRLKSELEAYYSDPNNGAVRYRLRLNDGGGGQRGAGLNWLVEVVWRGERPTRLFWNPHLDCEADVKVVTNAPLFLRAQSGNHRLRVMTVNDRRSLIQHRKHQLEPALQNYEECFHYISLGDFRLTLALNKYFVGENRHAETKVVYSSRDSDDPLNPGDKLDREDFSNIVAFGNRRVSWVLRELEDRIRPNFTIVDDDTTTICNRAPRADENPYYHDELKPDGSLFAVLIRSAQAEGAVTLINVQNGPALEAMADILTSDEQLEPILLRAGWNLQTEAPRQFELLFEIRLASKELTQRAEPPRLVGYRVGQSGRG